MEVADYDSSFGPAVAIKKRHRIIQMWDVAFAVKFGVEQFLKAYFPALHAPRILRWLASLAKRLGFVPKLPRPNIPRMI